MAMLHVSKFVTIVFYLLLDLIFTKKNNFWHYVYVKFNIFSATYIFEKNEKMPFWATDLFLFKYGFLDLYWLYSDKTYSLLMLPTS